ncbi:MAG: hypothetical protein R2825_16935 [Saprospiraceae bacterium]
MTEKQLEQQEKLLEDQLTLMYLVRKRFREKSWDGGGYQKI